MFRTFVRGMCLLAGTSQALQRSDVFMKKKDFYMLDWQSKLAMKGDGWEQVPKEVVNEILWAKQKIQQEGCDEVILEKLHIFFITHVKHNVTGDEFQELRDHLRNGEPQDLLGQKNK